MNPTPPTKTLRDEFAMAALAALAGPYKAEAKALAESAYEIADAMLEARARADPTIERTEAGR